MSEHIVKSFDDELSQLNAAIARMGESAQFQFAATMSALRMRDVEAAARVIRDDIDVDALERDIESRAIRVLALRQPIARDLREVISTLRVVVELERICDFSANICKRVIALNTHSPEQWLVEIGELGELAKKQLAEQKDVRLGNEKNFVRVEERLKPFEDKVKLHETNVDSIKKELSNTR